MSETITRLHHALPVTGERHNRYCGPAAIAALTGISTGQAAAMIRDVSNRPWVKGTSTNQMLDVLSSLGLEVADSVTYYPMTRVTLRRWASEFWTGGLALVEAMNHWWAMDSGYFVDSWNRMPTPVSELHNPKSYVCNVFYLE